MIFPHWTHLIDFPRCDSSVWYKRPHWGQQMSIDFAIQSARRAIAPTTQQELLLKVALSSMRNRPLCHPDDRGHPGSIRAATSELATAPGLDASRVGRKTWIGPQLFGRRRAGSSQCVTGQLGTDRHRVRSHAVATVLPPLTVAQGPVGHSYASIECDGNHTTWSDQPQNQDRVASPHESSSSDMRNSLRLGAASEVHSNGPGPRGFARDWH